MGVLMLYQEGEHESRKLHHHHHQEDDEPQKTCVTRIDSYGKDVLGESETMDDSVKEESETMDDSVEEVLRNYNAHTSDTEGGGNKNLVNNFQEIKDEIEKRNYDDDDNFIPSLDDLVENPKDKPNNVSAHNNPNGDQPLDDNMSFGSSPIGAAPPGVEMNPHAHPAESWIPPHRLHPDELSPNGIIERQPPPPLGLNVHIQPPHSHELSPSGSLDRHHAAGPPPPLEGGDGRSPPLCAGCSLRIADGILVVGGEQKWHSRCLKCAECGVQLENHQSCYEKEGLIFCKSDYFKLFPGKKPEPETCGRCKMKFEQNEYAMRASEHLCFHIDCFRCAQCDNTLQKGSMYALMNGMPYCYDHYTGGAQLPHQPPMPTPYGQDHTLPNPAMGDPMYFDVGHPFPPHFGGQPHPGEAWGPPPPGEFHMGPGGPDFPYDNNNEPMLKKRRGRKKRKVETSFASMNGFLDGSYGPMDANNQAKTKRARTSFKHHQLRIMKNHFTHNQNPDSRELKMLSQKTGLDKKVLQVWFQNARAKWRRTSGKEGGGAVGGGSGQMGQQQGGDLGCLGDEASPNSDCSGPMIPVC